MSDILRDALANYWLQQIATYLIIYRVAEGKAWGSNEMSGQTLTSVVNIDPRSMLMSHRDMAVAVDSKAEVTVQERRQRPDDPREAV